MTSGGLSGNASLKLPPSLVLIYFVDCRLMGLYMRGLTITIYPFWQQASGSAISMGAKGAIAPEKIIKTDYNTKHKE